MNIVKIENAALGAFIEGLDLTTPLREEDFTELKRALHENEVVFFHGQNISRENHRNLGLAFGSLQIHPSFPTVDGFPEIAFLENDREQRSKINEWHTDMSFKPIPSMASILIGRIVPEHGGDTAFSSLGNAYDDLPESTKKSLQGLTATHSYAHGWKDTLAEAGNRELLQPALDRNPDVVHPVVRTHPMTGRKTVFLNRTFTSHINGLSEQDSEELMNYLCDHMVQEKYVYRFKWQTNSIAFWDNRAVMHKPINDYWPALRRMERVTINDTQRPS